MATFNEVSDHLTSLMDAIADVALKLKKENGHDDVGYVISLGITCGIAEAKQAMEDGSRFDETDYKDTAETLVLDALRSLAFMNILDDVVDRAEAKTRASEGSDAE